MQCKVFAEEGSSGINVLKKVLKIAFKAGIHKVGDSPCVFKMATGHWLRTSLECCTVSFG